MRGRGVAKNNRLRAPSSSSMLQAKARARARARPLAAVVSVRPSFMRIFLAKQKAKAKLARENQRQQQRLQHRTAGAGASARSPRTDKPVPLEEQARSTVAAARTVETWTPTIESFNRKKLQNLSPEFLSYYIANASVANSTGIPGEQAVEDATPCFLIVYAADTASHAPIAAEVPGTTWKHLRGNMWSVQAPTVEHVQRISMAAGVREVVPDRDGRYAR